jgi:TPR repeat protein
LRAIVARIDAKTPTPADFAKLEADARAGDMRAVELLAWCAYAGIGGPPDPIRAYFLYGRAAAAGLTAMARNQATVYATMLSSEQRQQIAEIENSQ